MCARAARPTRASRSDFCHGQDRLWQLEFFRRATAGRLAEFAGPDALHADVLMRTIGMRRIAEREEREISTLLRVFLDAYAAGINAAIETAAALPVEFQLVRLAPEPWTAVDLLAASKLMAFGLSTNWELELLRARLVRDAGAERTARLEPQYPRANPYVTAPGQVLRGRGNRPRTPDRTGPGDARARRPRRRARTTGSSRVRGR